MFRESENIHNANEEVDKERTTLTSFSIQNITFSYYPKWVDTSNTRTASQI